MYEAKKIVKERREKIKKKKKKYYPLKIIKINKTQI